MTTRLASWLGGNRRRTSRKPRSYQPAVAGLEHRVLLSTGVSIKLNNKTNIVSIIGNEKDNEAVAQLSKNGQKVQVLITDVNKRGKLKTIKKTFNLKNVAQIQFEGRDGNDRFVNMTAIRSVARGGNGDDVLYGGWAGDFLFGDEGSDQLFGREGDDELDGGNGDDSLDGGDGDDQLAGQGGRDLLYGGDGADIMSGHEGNDRLYGEAGNDVLFGGSGDDWLEGGDDNDTLVGGEGVDWLLGQAGNDFLTGEAGNDVHYGGSGNDILYGDIGADYLDGGSGDDWLDGQWPSSDEWDKGDFLVGGPGADTFVRRWNHVVWPFVDFKETVDDFSAGDGDTTDEQQV
jgi:Ca2+-binding RTX toxin-like protein